MTTTRWKDEQWYSAQGKDTFQVRRPARTSLGFVIVALCESEERAAQIVHEHNALIEEQEHPERVIDKYFEDYSKLKRANAAMVEALEVAYNRSIERSERNVKWTQKDQDAHETIKAALDMVNK